MIRSGFCLRRVKIRREENGFGFTLRHFVVYPPELYANNDDERRNRKPVVTEPVDTIFVRSVVENGPAKRAGLCVGDRIVCVNGRTIFGRSYDNCVQLIQKSPDILCLDVSPKQYDPLQLFYEETAYRPETNQRRRPYQNSFPPATPARTSHSSDNYDYPDYDYPSSSLYSQDRVYNNTSIESFFLSNPSQQTSMSSSHPNSSSSHPQLFSHLPLPTPYKSSEWMHSGQPHPSTSRSSKPIIKGKSQPQTYYPFNQDLQSSQSAHLWKIKEEANAYDAKSGRYDASHHRPGSVDCMNIVPLTSHVVDVSSSENWNSTLMQSGKRYASYDEGCKPESSSHSLRRDSTGSIPNSNVQNSMVVTMASTNSKMQSSYPTEQSDSGSSLVGAQGSGYETKIVDRIRRSCEQKDEFLKRPNQPLQWVTYPLQSSLTHPKELYAQPQKFEKVPWPPPHVVPNVTSAKAPPIQSCQANSGSLDSQMKTHCNVSVVDVKHYPEFKTSRTLDESEQDCGSNSLGHIQTSSICNPAQQATERSLSPSWLEYAPRNRTTIIGSKKLHCDPPPDWHPDLSALAQAYGEDFVNNENANPVVEGAGEVKLRHRSRDDDLDETDRLVRRVSYLKATSSPIDMDRKCTSPTSPTLSCGVSVNVAATPLIADVSRRRSVANKISAEFFQKGRIRSLRQFFEERTQPTSIFKFSSDRLSPTSEHRGFGNLLEVKSPDNSDIVRDGHIHYKIKLGENKKGGYSRSWRQGWAQIRRTGCLYILSKEPPSREAITITEDSVILAVSLRGVTVEQAEDYSKKKSYVLRIKTSYPTVDIAANIAENAHPPSHSTQSVEILLQADDINEFTLWLQCFHNHLGNNNYCNENSNNFKVGIYFGQEFCSKSKSLLTSFLPSPATSSADKSNAGTNSFFPGQANISQTAGSPKNKTWKGKVARQWKKVHNIIETGDSKGISAYSSIPPVGATFGLNLNYCPPGENNPLIPRVIEYAIEVVERRGIDMVGLYRIPGNNASVAALTDRLNKGEEPDPEKDPKWLDVHVVASLIKSFLRRLPDPLLTDDRYPAFIIAADDADAKKCQEKMQLLINSLPDTNYETLRAVILHLKTVAEHGDSNRMDARNLAIVFGPTIVRTAEENVTSMVQDMKNQCKIVELLILHADELFKDRRLKDYEPSKISSSAKSNSAEILSFSGESERLKDSVVSPSSPTIESEIQASKNLRFELVQAAMRKVTKHPQDIHNVYGLPKKQTKKGKPSIDDAGFIRSYAGLNEETEQRVRDFERETRAMLSSKSREDRSPHSSAINVGVKPLATFDDFRMRRLNLDDELRRAKDDLENEDIYDQLADNPSNIVHHRDRTLHVYSANSEKRNLSNSSLSSSNSNGTSISYPTSGGITQKLGPAPFTSSFVSQSLPPKPPVLFQNYSSFSMAPGTAQSKTTFSSASPNSVLRRINSMDLKFEMESGAAISSGMPELVDSLGRKLGNTTPFVPKYFGGSLDSLSLKDISHQHEGSHSKRRDTVLCEDFSPKSSEGSDLVSSLSRTLDKKLQKLRSPGIDSENTNACATFTNGEKHFEKSILKNTEASQSKKPNGISENTNCNDTEEVVQNISKKSGGKSKVGGNGLKRSWRRNSMIERRANEVYNGGGSAVKEFTSYDNEYYRNPSLHRMNVEYIPSVTSITQFQKSKLTKDAKTVSNKLTRDCRRRHSLSGGGDILSLAYHDKSIRYFDEDDAPVQESTNSDCISAAGVLAGVLESHV